MSSNRIILIFVFLCSFHTLMLANDTNNIVKKLSGQSQQAIIHFMNQDFEKSLLLSRDVLKKALLIKDNNIIATSYNIIGANYSEFSDFDKSIVYYKKALFYANKTKSDTLKYRINNNLGTIYCFEKSKYKTGVQYYKNAIFYSNKIPNKTFRLITSLNMAWAFFDNSNYDEGIKYLKYANENFEKFGNESLSTVYNMINGMNSAYNYDFKKSKHFFEKAINLGYKYDQLNDVSYAHNEFSKLLFKMGNYKDAYIHLKRFDELKDQIYNDDKLFKASIVGLNVELDEYKRELTKIEIIKDAQNQNFRKSKIIVLLFIIVFFIFLFLISTLIRNNKFKKHINEELIIVNNNLLVAKLKAEEASQMKSQFVSTISHELRTPLYGVLGITNILIDEHKELSQSPHLKSLKFSAKYLLSLVNDILQINKIEENRVVLENLSFNISDEIKMIINSLSFLSISYSNNIDLSLDSNLPEYVIGDKLRFSQIIMNLVSNALKFTKNGTVTISAEVEKSDENLCYIGFKIQDTGVGIAKKDQEKIFDKFVQLGRHDTDYQGTGLGLSIVKSLLHLFNSSIFIESELGEGTTFRFTIPFEISKNKNNTFRNKIKVNLSKNKKISVLIVEDNKINQLVTKKIMDKNHIKSCLVDDGFKAIEILNKEFFDIILMDINMPLLNGFETTKIIRNNNNHTPIIGLTAFDKDEVVVSAISSGMNELIIKPFDESDLFDAINRLIDLEKSVD